MYPCKKALACLQKSCGLDNRAMALRTPFETPRAFVPGTDLWPFYKEGLSDGFDSERPFKHPGVALYSGRVLTSRLHKTRLEGGNRAPSKGVRRMHEGSSIEKRLIYTQGIFTANSPEPFRTQNQLPVYVLPPPQTSDPPAPNLGATHPPPRQRINPPPAIKVTPCQ